MQNKVEKNKPKIGDVRMISITEKQYGEMKILVGQKSYKEEHQTIEYLVEL